MTKIYRRPRLSVDITEEQDLQLSNLLDHGMKKIIFGVIVEDLIDMCNTFGAPKILGLLMERSISLKEICKLEKES